jgi:hypothetical protein
MFKGIAAAVLARMVAMSERGFAHHVLDELTPTLRLLAAEHREELAERVLADLTGLDRPTGPLGPPPTPRGLFLRKVVARLSDIDAALRSIRMAAVFCRQFPARRTYEAQGITESAYLTYHVEHYWQELYRLRESLLGLVKIVARQAARDARDQHERARVKQLGDGLANGVEAAFKHVSEFRGELVHQSRYRDDDIGRLDSLNLIMTQFDDDDRQAFATLHDEIYRNKRAEAGRQIESMAHALEPQIEKIYETLDRILYGRSGPPAAGNTRSA